MYGDKKNKIIALLIAIVIILSIFLIYNQVQEANQRKLNLAYQQGQIDTITQVQKDIINQLNNFGFFSITLPTGNNQTINIKLIPEPQLPVTE